MAGPVIKVLIQWNSRGYLTSLQTYYFSQLAYNDEILIKQTFIALYYNQLFTINVFINSINMDLSERNTWEKSFVYGKIDLLIIF